MGDKDSIEGAQKDIIEKDVAKAKAKGRPGKQPGTGISFGGKLKPMVTTPIGIVALLVPLLVGLGFLLFGGSSGSTKTATVNEPRPTASSAEVTRVTPAEVTRVTPSTTRRVPSTSVRTEVVPGGRSCENDVIVHAQVTSPGFEGQTAALQIDGPGGGTYPFTVASQEFTMPFHEGGCSAPWDFYISRVGDITIPHTPPTTVN